MDYFKYNTRYQPEKGRLLTSEPYLSDPNFERTLILLAEHNEDGTVGFILNKPSESHIADVMPDITNIDSPVFIGGPVQQDTLHYIHQIDGISESVPIIEGIYWGGNFDQILALIETRQIDEEDIKFFLGYSGWSTGQLAEEMKLNSWIVGNCVSREFIFNTEPEQMWRKSLQDLGGRFSMYSNYPVDPSMN
jgi:putative transcriptional regulator